MATLPTGFVLDSAAPTLPPGYKLDPLMPTGKPDLSMRSATDPQIHAEEWPTGVPTLLATSLMKPVSNVQVAPPDIGERVGNFFDYAVKTNITNKQARPLEQPMLDFTTLLPTKDELPPDTTDFGRVVHGAVRGAASVASGLTSMENVGLAAGTGLAAGAAAEAPALIRTIIKGGTAGLDTFFATSLGQQATALRPEIKQAYDAGDYGTAAEKSVQWLGTLAIGGVALGTGARAAKGVEGEVAAGIEQHNTLADRLLQYETQLGHQREVGMDVAGRVLPASIPIEIAGKPARIESAGVSEKGRPFYNVIDSAEKKVYTGTGGDVQSFLKMQGAVPKAEVPQFPVERVEQQAATLPDEPLAAQAQEVARMREDITPPKPSEPFYSQLEQIASEKVQGPTPASQVLAMLRNPSSGVKQDELHWTGIGTWLEAKGDKKVTPDELLQQVQENRLPEEIQVQPSKYSSHNTLWTPGTTDHRDVLFYNEPAADYQDRHWSDSQISNYDPAVQGMGKPMGVAQHLRISDLTEQDGTKTLVVEENQSDLHQAGREQGYMPSPQERNSLQQKKTELMQQLAVAETQEEKEDIIRQYGQLVQQLRDLPSTVPSAPFAKSWHERGMRWALWYAATHGYDKVAWTTGETQNKRYSLQQVADQLEYSPDRGSLVALKDGFSTANYAGVTPEKLPQYVGKEIANRLLTSPVDANGKYTLTGNNLEVGGSGMRGFYDKILPDYVGRFVKKYGAVVQSGAQHSISITPRMREALSRGTPQFQSQYSNPIQDWTPSNAELTKNSLAAAPHVKFVPGQQDGLAPAEHQWLMQNVDYGKLGATLYRITKAIEKVYQTVPSFRGAATTGVVGMTTDPRVYGVNWSYEDKQFPSFIFHNPLPYFLAAGFGAADVKAIPSVANYLATRILFTAVHELAHNLLKHDLPDTAFEQLNAELRNAITPLIPKLAVEIINAAFDQEEIARGPNSIDPFRTYFSLKPGLQQAIQLVKNAGWRSDRPGLSLRRTPIPRTVAEVNAAVQGSAPTRVAASGTGLVGQGDAAPQRIAASPELTSGPLAHDLGGWGVTIPQYELADELYQAHQHTLPPFNSPVSPEMATDEITKDALGTIDDVLKRTHAAEKLPKRIKERIDEDMVIWNKALRLGGFLTHIVMLNRGIEPLQRYYGVNLQWQHYKVSEVRKFDETMQEWRKLGREQGSILTELLMKADLLSYRLHRKLKPEEWQSLGLKMKATEATMEVMKQVRAAFDWSLDEMERVMKVDVDALAASGTLDEAATKAKYAAIETQVGTLRKTDYFPHTRFGEHIVRVIVQGDKPVVYQGKKAQPGQTLVMETFETQYARDLRRKELAQEFNNSESNFDGPSYLIQDDILDDAPFAFVGYPPAMLDALKSHLDLTVGQAEKLASLMIDLAPSNSFINHLRKRRRIYGMSMDGMRVFGTYGVQLINHLAKIQYRPDMQRAVGDMGRFTGPSLKKIGAIRNWMNRHLYAAMNPRADFAGIRSFLWYTFFAFNPKHIVQNMTQVFIDIAPRVIAELPVPEWKKDVVFAKMLAKASVDVAAMYSPKSWDETKPNKWLSADEQWMLKKAEDDGLLEQTFAAMMSVYVGGMPLNKMLPLELFGLHVPMREAGIAIRNFLEAGILPFRISEEFMRRQCAVLAFRAGLMKGWDREAAYHLTEEVVRTCMVEYASWNKSELQRGNLAGKPKGGSSLISTALIFRTFQFNRVFNLLSRQPGWFRSWLAQLVLMGAKGIIGGAILIAIINAAMTHIQRMRGKKEPLFDLEQQMSAFAIALGLDPNMLVNGIGASSFGLTALFKAFGLPLPLITVASTMQMGPEIPGVIPVLDAIKQLPGKPDFANFVVKQMSEFGGVSASLGANLLRESMAKGNRGLRAVKMLQPGMVANLVRGYEMLSGGLQNAKGQPQQKFDIHDPMDWVRFVSVLGGAMPSEVVATREADWARAEQNRYYQGLRGVVMEQQWQARQHPGEREAISAARKSWMDVNQTLPPGYKISAQDVINYIRTHRKEEALTQRGLPPSKKQVPLYRELDKYFPLAPPTGQRRLPQAGAVPLQ